MHRTVPVAAPAASPLPWTAQLTGGCCLCCCPTAAALPPCAALAPTPLSAPMSARDEADAAAAAAAAASAAQSHPQHADTVTPQLVPFTSMQFAQQPFLHW